MVTTTAPAWTSRPRKPVREYSRPCPCGRTLYRTVTGNIVDYRHQGPCAREEQRNG